MEDIVFFEAEEMEANVPAPVLLLACNAPQQEDWLRNALPDFEEGGRVKNVTELRKTLKSLEKVDMAILLRKNPTGGVEKPEDMAAVILEHSPQAKIFIIVGSHDERARKIIERAEELGCTTLVAEKGKSITGSSIREGVEKLANEIREENAHTATSLQEEVEEGIEPLHIIYVEKAKGGSGATTALTALARLLQQRGDAISVWDQTSGVSFLIDAQAEGISILQKWEDKPETGWLLVDGPLPEEGETEIQEGEPILHHVLVCDPSPESLHLAKKKVNSNTIIVVNRTLPPESLPVEIYEEELTRKPDVMVYASPETYLMMDEKILSDWEPLLRRLKE